MSMLKAIEHGKEHRKLYGGFMDYVVCRYHHGPCSWCVKGRLYQSRKELAEANDKMKEAMDDLSFDKDV